MLHRIDNEDISGGPAYTFGMRTMAYDCHLVFFNIVLPLTTVSFIIYYPFHEYFHCTINYYFTHNRFQGIPAPNVYEMQSTFG